MEDSDRDLVSEKTLGDESSRAQGLRSRERLRQKAGGEGGLLKQCLQAAMNYGRRNAVEVCFGNSYAVRGITLRMCDRRIGCAWRVMG